MFVAEYNHLLFRTKSPVFNFAGLNFASTFDALRPQQGRELFSVNRVIVAQVRHHLPPLRCQGAQIGALQHMMSGTLLEREDCAFADSDRIFTVEQGGRSCTGARVVPAEKFGLRRKF